MCVQMLLWSFCLHLSWSQWYYLILVSWKLYPKGEDQGLAVSASSGQFWVSGTDLFLIGLNIFPLFLSMPHFMGILSLIESTLPHILEACRLHT